MDIVKAMGRIRCIHGYVLIEPIEKKETSGIISPSSVNLPNYTGKVLATGEGSPDGAGSVVPMKLKVGDIVHFDNAPSKRKEIELDGQTLYYMDQLAVFAVIEEEEVAEQGVVISE